MQKLVRNCNPPDCDNELFVYSQRSAYQISPQRESPSGTDPLTVESGVWVEGRTPNQRVSSRAVGSNESKREHDVFHLLYCYPRFQYRGRRSVQVSEAAHANRAI